MEKNIEVMTYEEIWDLAKDELVFLPEPVRNIVKDNLVFLLLLI